MIFKVQNLGYIEEASVDLSKDLIVLTGQNNTGKTYLAYAIYGLFSKSESVHYLELEYEDLNEVDNSVNYNFKDIFLKYRNVITDIMINKIDLNKLFPSDSNIFQKFTCDLVFNDKDLKKINEYQRLTTFLNLNNNSYKSMLLDFHRELAYHNIEQRLFPNTYIAPAERNAINIFSKELSLTKSKLFRNGNDAVKNAQFVNRYPKPIQNNLEIAEDLAFLSKNQSEFEYLAIELEHDFLKGKITTNQYGQIEYQPDNQKDISLEIHLTASMVKSLSNIVFYLRHLAQKGDCIIIDEPELNLHPDNQRKIARFIGRLINEGFQVVISTHSDYIIKELNNMIMLSKAKGNNQDLIEKLGFRGDELLKPEQVQALLFTLDSRKPTDIEITEEGFEVATINEVIEKQDNDMETIYYELFQKVM